MHNYAKVTSSPSECCSFPQEIEAAGGVQRGLPPRLDIRQPPLGVLWLLSVATESNNFASADATGAASKMMLDSPIYFAFKLSIINE